MNEQPDVARVASMATEAGPNIQEVSQHLDSAVDEWRLLAEIWARHISNARDQIETAIVSLSQEFADIVISLDDLAITAQRIESEEQRLARSIMDSARAEGDQVVDELASTARQLRLGTANIHRNINAALVHLQFQDRIDQILGHVEANMHLLPGVLADYRDGYKRNGQLAPVDFSALVRAIEASYTTTEERGAHRGASPVGSDDDIYYF
jgi:methyl-accepting chemotaxis protein